MTWKEYEESFNNDADVIEHLPGEKRPAPLPLFKGPFDKYEIPDYANPE